ncbi:CPBP family intramembrane metalloprotease [Bradyrhizobium brasilense]|uniref:CPBP family intramembrane glutamic endopeptidase n=1 Tax=Bradyrhizobium brasilense TaxID=1419277 RepID=UPI0028774B8E|nr:CPBP family intramembrane glutamic endopeptidase [Bradyrhizobium brasilense]MCP3417398.1 CPBP family intramembrane metalloprotease [Bradyrhizobium brasilense]
MSNFENANAPVPAPPQRTWDFVETAFVILIAYGVFTLVGGWAMTIIIAAQDGVARMSPAQLRDFAAQGRWYGAGLTIASPLTIGVLWIAIRKARRGFEEYLALNWPSPAEAMRAFAIFAGILLGESVINSSVGGEGAAVDDPVFVVKGANGLMILLIGTCIAGPIMEEFLIRGFLYRGWSESFLGPIGAIVLTAAVWAMTHTQYDVYGKLEIFGMGLALGYCRWRSNSTWLTVMIHSALNTFIFFVTGPYV